MSGSASGAIKAARIESFWHSGRLGRIARNDGEITRFNADLDLATLPECQNVDTWWAFFPRDRLVFTGIASTRPVGHGRPRLRQMLKLGEHLEHLGHLGRFARRSGGFQVLRSGTEREHLEQVMLPDAPDAQVVDVWVGEHLGCSDEVREIP